MTRSSKTGAQIFWDESDDTWYWDVDSYDMLAPCGRTKTWSQALDILIQCQRIWLGRWH